MEFLITGGAFLGAALGRSFKVPILIPACFLIVVMLLVSAGSPNFTFFRTVVKIGVLIISLELGYLVGLISTDLAAARQGFRSLWSRSRTHSGHNSHQARLR